MRIFITGVGRSGTTLLQCMLASHSEICFPPETGFLRKVVFSPKHHRSLSFQQALTLEPRLARLKPSMPAEVPDRFADEMECYQWVMHRFGEFNGASVTGDKDPRLLEYLEGVSRFFPDARFIQIVRDPRDVLLSKKRAKWSADRHPLRLITAGYVQMKLSNEMGRRLGRDHFYRIVYERLLRHPEEELKELCSFLELPFESSMLEFQQKARELISADENEWKREVTGPLMEHNTGKWRGELKEWEVALTEALNFPDEAGLKQNIGSEVRTQHTCFGSHSNLPSARKQCASDGNLSGGPLSGSFKEGLYRASGAFDRLSTAHKAFFRWLLIPAVKLAGTIYIFYRKFYQRFIVWKKGRGNVVELS